MHQSVASAPDSIDLDAIFRPIADYNLLRFWRIEEALKRLNGQVRLQGVSIHGAKALDLALLRMTCDTFGVDIINAILASIAKPDDVIDFIRLQFGSALALIVLSSQYRLSFCVCPLTSSNAANFQPETFGHL
jgi:hypothetical protein